MRFSKQISLLLLLLLLLLFVLIIFSPQHVLETHRLMYKELNSFVYIFAVNFQVFQITQSGCVLSYKVQNWHTLSREQYFLKH